MLGFVVYLQIAIPVFLLCTTELLSFGQFSGSVLGTIDTHTCAGAFNAVPREKVSALSFGGATLSFCNRRERNSRCSISENEFPMHLRFLVCLQAKKCDVHSWPKRERQVSKSMMFVVIVPTVRVKFVWFGIMQRMAVDCKYINTQH